MFKSLANSFVVAMLLFIVSCSQKESLITPDTPVKGPGVTVKDGYLKFNSYQDFLTTRESLSKQSTEGLNSWESQFSGFESQRALFESLLDEDIAHRRRLESLPSEQLEKLKGSKNKDFIYAVGILENKHLLSFDEYGYYLSLSSHEEGIERFVNKAGLVQIGDSLYEYSQKYIKIIRDGDARKLALLKDITESSKEKGVDVIEIRPIELTAEQKANLKINFAADQTCIGYTGGGGQRVIGRAILGERIYNDIRCEYGCGVVYQPYAYLRAENQYKGLFGWETKRTSGLRIVGWNIGYNIRNWSKSNISVDKGTNGNLETAIEAGIFGTTQWLHNLPYAFEFYGNATFYGRDGSQCSM